MFKIPTLWLLVGVGALVALAWWRYSYVVDERDAALTSLERVTEANRTNLTTITRMREDRDRRAALAAELANKNAEYAAEIERLKGNAQNDPELDATAPRGLLDSFKRVQ
jgi:hypothetical protein